MSSRGFYFIYWNHIFTHSGLLRDALDYNIHTEAHIYRAGQEAVAYSFCYGLDILRENNIHSSIIKAGNSNLFLSDVFTETFANATNTTVEIFETDGSKGAAVGAAIGAGVYKDAKDVFSDLKPLKTIYPLHSQQTGELYSGWKYDLENLLTKSK